ncbi:hypothetical protein OESDEN_15609, partial [Oesophagostomum dentatum]
TSPTKWYTNSTANINFLNSVLSRASQYGLSIGIYTSNYDWYHITGEATITNAVLWYWFVYGDGTRNESPANYGDFQAFGGWTTPTVKQFGQDEIVCGVTVNRDVYTLSAASKAAGMAKYENSEQVVVGSLGLANPLSGKAEIIVQLPDLAQLDQFFLLLLIDASPQARFSAPRVLKIVLPSVHSRMRTSILICTLTLSCFAGPVVEQEAASELASYGFAVDVSAGISFSSWGYSPAGQGQLDPYACANIQNANAAGLGTEVYMTPLPFSNKTGAQQFDEMYEGLTNANINVRSVWIQVTYQWSGSNAISFLNSILSRAGQYGLSTGIYTGLFQWDQVTHGATVNNAMLWYSNVYGNGTANESPPNYDDFQPIGGWTTPMAKQFALVESVCGVTVNRDLYSLSAASKAAGMAKYENSEQVVVGSLGLGRPISGKAEIIVQ